LPPDRLTLLITLICASGYLNRAIVGGKEWCSLPFSILPPLPPSPKGLKHQPWTMCRLLEGLPSMGKCVT
jgi:hypothetical protein